MKKHRSSSHKQKTSIQKEDIIQEVRNGRINKIALYPELFRTFLEDHGFRSCIVNGKVTLVKQKNNIIEPCTLSKIKQFITSFIQNNCPQEEQNRLIYKLVTTNKLISPRTVESLEEIKIQDHKDTSEATYFYFKNGIVKVTSKKISILPYSILKDKVIWQSQIIPHEISDVGRIENTDVIDFLQYISGQDDERLLSLLSTIGYLLSRYKNPVESQAVVLMDESQNPDYHTNGRTGKSLIFEMISKLRKVTVLSGRAFDADRFPFEQVETTTDIILFDDAKKNFDFTDLYQILTGSLVIEKKFKSKFEIPFEKSPKVGITTNYTIIGGGGESEKARKHIVELAPYFNSVHTPNKVFGYRFFCEITCYTKWWHDFYNTMFFCSQIYLREGLVKYKLKNAEKKELINRTSLEFVEFMEQKNLKTSVDYDLQELLTSFRKITDNKTIEAKQFNPWVRTYIAAKELKTKGEEQKSPRAPLHMSSGKLKLRILPK